MTKRSTKKSLVLSCLALLLCFSMLIGTTFAWFTDSVASEGNIIQTGTLDVEMYWAAGAEDPASATWNDASAGAIFNSTLWEPGYVEARHIKVANVGTLALKYQLAIVPNGEVSKLAEVIDVYFIEGATQVDRANLGTAKGTLADLINGGIASGNLTANTECTYTIVLKMQETAGNEYQNLSIGTDFSVQLYATQYTYEEDSFDKTYDEDANISFVATLDDLKSALADGGSAVLTADIAVDGNLSLADGAAIYGNGKTLTNATLHAGEGVILENVVFDGVATNANGNASHVYAGGSITVDGCTFTNSDYDAVQFTPVAGSELVITNCVFGAGNAYRSIHIQPKNDVAADENNGITLVLENNYIDISRLVEGKTYYENQICIVGVFADNITAANNTVVYGGGELSQKAAWVGVNTTGVNGDGGKWEYWDDATINKTLAFTYIVPVTDQAGFVAALAEGGEVYISSDVALTEQLNVTKDTVIIGNGNTLTYTGSANRVIDVATNTGADLTVKDLVIEINNGYCQRGINYNVPNGNLVLENVTLSGDTKATYGINLPGSSDGVTVTITDCDLTANIALNIWGENSNITVTNSNLSNYDPTDEENYATIVLNNDNITAATGTTLTVVGGSITAKDENGDPCSAVSILAESTVSISDTTVVVGNITSPVALIGYLDANGGYYPQYYSSLSLQSAVTKAAEADNAVVVLMRDQNVEVLNVPANVKVDLNGFKLTIGSFTGEGKLTYVE